MWVCCFKFNLLNCKHKVLDISHSVRWNGFSLTEGLWEKQVKVDANLQYPCAPHPALTLPSHN